MWQFYVYMSLAVLTFISGVRNYNKPVVSGVDTSKFSHVFIGIITCLVLFYLSYSILSVTWVPLSIALITLSGYNAVRTILELLFNEYKVYRKSISSILFSFVSATAYIYFYVVYVVK